ncbi:chemotaxis protein CheW [Cohnella luojiensis]|uniref:Chemotaxis protein CheW n=1 Tax=Cohnella luojiensis TaxID=652876 RepID=A0A4Y8LV84_9BACL|nr:chemotaxis protein CheW [Cohnella luojiensis]TFE25418.1 chemotaxis protein CheW [Cohnella luojiensis]
MGSNQGQFIEVGIAKERYAIKIYDIHEIIKMQDITAIPNSKPHIKGVINLRGKIVPIISLRNRFGMEEDPYSRTTRIVVVNHGEEIVGIVVDRVNQVITFSDIQSPPERVGGVDGSYFSGIGHSNGGLVSLLKLDQVLYE